MKTLRIALASLTLLASASPADDGDLVARYRAGEVATSDELAAATFAAAIRNHWAIENQNHWVRDVTLAEDASRIRKGNAPAIMTTIRHLSMNLFEQEPSKLRCSQKRRKAAWDDDYRARECRRAQDAKRDIPVALSPCARRQPLCPGSPRSGPRLRHFAPTP